MSIDFVKKYIMLPVLFTVSCIEATPLGLVGGKDFSGSDPAYSALVAPGGPLTPLTGLPSTGTIRSVDINSSAHGLIGGFSGPNSPFASELSFAAFVSPEGQLTPITGFPSPSAIFTVAINSSGYGLVGGQFKTSPTIAFASIVAPDGQLFPINGLPITSSEILSVAINDSIGLIGGGGFGLNTPIAAFVSLNGQLTSINGVPGSIYGVAINSSSVGIIGGNSTTINVSGTAYAAIVSPNGPLIPINGLPSTGNITSVAINDSSTGIIGGFSGATAGSGPAFAAFVAPGGHLTSIINGLPTTGSITSVAINSSSVGLIGGFSGASLGSGPAYAAFVAPGGQLTPLTGLPNLGNIAHVAINDFSQGLIGGFSGAVVGTGPAFAALVMPTGQVIPLNIGLSLGNMPAVALLSLLPTEGLSGNNRAFANYINDNAPYDAFYFVPAYFEGKLAKALEKAAPTRNAFSLFAADNNMFYLDSLLSNYSRNRRSVRRLASETSSRVAAIDIPADQLTAWNSPWMNEKEETCQERPYEIWGTVLGAAAYQKKQQQTPGFQPLTGGVILGFDGKVANQTKLGIGAAYTYTHIHQNQGMGHSHINQEYLFLYSLWDNTQWYVDAAVMAGCFQIDNVRKIHIPAFTFQAKSHPHGWQIAPHFEFGYDFNTEASNFTTEPFAMVDWINNWQGHYKEKGSSPFNVGQKRHHSSFLRSETGVRFYETARFETWNLIVQEKISYVNKKPFNVGKVNAFLVGAPGSFTVETLTTTQNLGVAELEFVFEPHNLNCPYTTVQYQGEFGSMYQSHLVSVNLTWDF